MSINYIYVCIQCKVYIIVTNNNQSYILFCFIFLIPNAITFLADFWVLGVKKRKDKPFPKARKDGLIIPDKDMRYKSFKNIICTLVHPTEKQATNICLGVTAIFCILAIVFI